MVAEIALCQNKTKGSKKLVNFKTILQIMISLLFLPMRKCFIHKTMDVSPVRLS